MMGGMEARRARAALVEGAERAGARAHFRAMGIDPARLTGPIIGVASTWTGTMPCNLNQLALSERVVAAVAESGGVAFRIEGRAAGASSLVRTARFPLNLPLAGSHHAAWLTVK